MPVRTRPSGLPEYSNPPLYEVVLGIQFQPVPGYQQVNVGEVRNLFVEKYPNVQEQTSLPPHFETFGRPHMPPFDVSQSFGAMESFGAMHNRYWFLTKSQENLVQFQNDRFLHNWRKVGIETNQYPRFENMISEFEAELNVLEQYFKHFNSQPLIINQVEVTYINHVEYAETDAPEKWFKIVGLEGEDLEGLNMSYRRLILSELKEPIGRLYVELLNAIKVPGKPIYALNFTVRGLPSNQTIAGALEFVRQGRAAIVNEFTSITTGYAHLEWGRSQ